MLISLGPDIAFKYSNIYHECPFFVSLDIWVLEFVASAMLR